VTDSRDSLRPSGLGERGHAFFTAMHGATEDNPARLVLLVDCARMLDALERYDRVLTGQADAYMEVKLDNGGVLLVNVSKVAAERRMTFGAIRLALNDLAGIDASRSPDKPADAPDAEVDLVDEFRKRRAARKAGT
jgi:hypothetical protein